MSSTKTKPVVPQESLARRITGFSPDFWIKVIVVFQLGLLAFEFSPDISTNGDDAKYYLLGKSLVSGNGYRDVYDPQNPVHTQYPPLFPAFLGVLRAVTQTPLLPKIAVGILSATVLLLLFYYLRPFARNLAIPVILIVGLSSSVASHATLLMSEMPYLFATLGALLLLERYRRRGGTGVVFWAAATVAVTPAFIRTVGIAFIAAWVVTAILDKKYRQAMATIFIFAGAMLFLRFATDWNSPYIDQLFRRSSYDPELGFVTPHEMLVRIGQNIAIYFSSVIPRLMIGVELKRGFAPVLVSLVFMIPAIIGWFRNFRLPLRFLSFYLLFYCGIVCMWQVQWAGERFLIPILPFIALFFLQGLETILGRIVPLFAKNETTIIRFRTGLLWAAALCIVAFNFNDHFRLISENAETTKDWKNFYSCADWVRLNTPRDAIVVTRKPELFYLRSLHQGFIYPFSHDVEKVIAGLKQGGARYCVLDNFFWSNTTVRYLFPAILSHPEMFRVVYSLRNPDTYVLEFMPK